MAFVALDKQGKGVLVALDLDPFDPDGPSVGAHELLDREVGIGWRQIRQDDEQTVLCEGCSTQRHFEGSRTKFLSRLCLAQGISTVIGFSRDVYVMC